LGILEKHQEDDKLEKSAMKKISPDTSIHDLLDEYPFLVEFLVELNPNFGLLKNPMMRATVGRAANLKKASEMGGVDLEEMMEAVRGEIRRRAEGSGDPDKVAELKSLILDLHQGVEPEAAKARFNTVVKDVSPEEIGAMEEQLIREGMPVEEIQRLCDLHVAVVQDSLDKQEEVEALPGHPLHTYKVENEIITDLANRLGALCGDERRDGFSGPGWSSDYLEVLRELAGIDNHYLRKENELFPALERHGITGPSKVMWGVHDEIRGQTREAREYLEQGSWESAARAGASLARSVIEMVYKENKILFPLAQQTLSHEEWEQVRAGEDELGYAFLEPGAPFPAGQASPGMNSAQEPETAKSGPGPRDAQAGPGGIGLPIVSPTPPASFPEASDQAYVDLGTGRLNVEQVDMILRHLPIEISFVDAEGFVRYYSDTEERLFPRTPGAIGRHVENCHPQKSLHMVREILEKFAAGERNVAEFWIEMQGRFIHIRYFAVHNGAGEYLGCLEVTQDISEIRALQGQRRLLEWR
jgi:DUF438 domain-containing protein